MARGMDLGKLEAWRRRMAAFQSSGLTVVAFCRQEGIGTARFYYWARRVRAASTDAPSPRTAKRKLASESHDRSDSRSVDVFIGSQVRVRLPASQPELIAAVVSSVAAAPADERAPAAFQRIDLIGSAAAGR